MTEEDLKNLEIVFTLARQQVVENETSVENLIIFRKQLFEKLKQVKQEKTQAKQLDLVQKDE